MSEIAVVDPPVIDPVGQSTESSLWENPSFAKFKGDDGMIAHEKLGQSYVELEKMMGSRVAIPGKESPPEDWAKYYDKFRPASPNDYEFITPGLDNLDEGKAQKWKATFHEKGLSQEQVNGVLHTFTQLDVEEQQTINQANLKLQTETQLALKQVWGANYDANKGMIQSMFREMGGDGLLDTMMPLLEYSKEGVEFFYQVARDRRTSGLLKDEGGGNFGLKSVDEATAEKLDIMTNSSNPLHASYTSNVNFEAREPAIKKINELNTIITNAQKRLG